MSAVLKKIGFEVFEYENLTRVQMDIAIEEFGLGLKKNDVALFFYAGHGIQSKGFNYLIPVDATLKSEALIDYQCVRADKILALMEEHETQINIILLDACRNNPFERSWTRGTSSKGLATMNAPIGTLIGYATSPGSTASDGSGNNGLYTSALLENIVVPGITIGQMFQNVGKIVAQKSGKEQIPWTASSLTDDFYFSPDTGSVPVSMDNPVVNEEKKAPLPKINGQEDWQLVKVTEDKAEVTGLTLIKRLKVKSFWGGKQGTDMGLNNCIRDLKMKAAEINCPVVLIVDKRMGITTMIEGIGYK